MLFLWIYLSDINGLEAVKNLRVDKDCRLVFTTASTEHAIEAFNLNAAHYLVKPFSKEQIADALKRCIFEDSSKNAKKLNIKSC